MKHHLALLSLTLVVFTTSCSLYSTKPEDIIAVTYAVAAKKAVVAKKKNKENETVNTWIGGIQNQATLTAAKISGKVDLSANAIPADVHSEVKKALGKDISVALLAPPSSNAGKKVPQESASGLPDWITIVWEGFKLINSASREKQRQHLNGILEVAKWGTDTTELPPTK